MVSLPLAGRRRHPLMVSLSNHVRVKDPAGDTLALAAIAACAVVLHREGLFGGAGFYERDTQIFYYPLAKWVAEQLHAGFFPLWLPGIFTGYPIFADGELGLAYLPQLLLLSTLPTDIAMVWERALHCFLAGAFTLWYLRSLRLETLPALGGALVFALGSFLSAQMHHENVVRSAVWLPAVLACLLRAVAEQRTRRRAIGWTALGAIAFAQSALGLHVQPVLMSSLAIAAYALFLAIRVRTLLPLVSAALIGGGGAALAAVQLLPLGEWALVSSRRGGVDYEFGSAFAIAPQSLATVLFPFFFRLPDATTWWSLWQQWEIELYVGIPTLALIVVGVLFSRRSEALFFALLGIVSLWVAMAHYAPLLNLHLWLWSVPGFSFLRAPGRFSDLVVFSCACLAALGLQALSARRARLVIALGGAVPTIGLLAALLALLPAWRGWLSADSLRALSYVSSTYLATRAQYPIDPQLVLSGMLYSLDLLTPKTLWTLLLLLLTALGFVGWLALHRNTLGQGLLVALIAVDLLVFASDFHPRAPLASFVPALTQGLAPGDRVLLHEPSDVLPFEPNQLLAAGVNTVDGYSSLPSQRHVELAAQTATQPGLFDLWAEQAIVEPANPIDARDVDGLRIRAQHPLVAGFGGAVPSVLRVPPELGAIQSVRIVGTLSYAFDVPQGTTVATVSLGATALPIRAGIELAERAYDRPSLRSLLQHQRAAVAFDFDEATPEGEAYTGHLYDADLALPTPGSSPTLTFTSTRSNVLVELHGIALVGAGGTRQLTLADREGLQQIGPTTLRNANALPRAFVLPKTQAFSVARHPGLTATQLVASPDVDIHRQVLIENDPDTPTEPAANGTEAQPARLVDVGANKVQVVATADQPSYLVVADFYHRGWTARVDGRPARVLIADAVFRGVAIDPGQHVVELSFEPLSHLVGLLVSAITLVVAGGLILWGLRTRVD